jgi:short subunit dehydrogenase-like uncharacterized protein
MSTQFLIRYLPYSFIRYHHEAQEKRLLVIHACAFDSVPADLGVHFCRQQFARAHTHDGYTLSSIECFLSLNSGPGGVGGHFTTFECAVHGIGDVESLRAIRAQVQGE